MNKTEFIKELEKLTGCTSEECAVVNEIMESHFVLSSKKKNEIVEDIMNRLSFSDEKASDVYEKAMQLIKNTAKDKLKHPFRSQD